MDHANLRKRLFFAVWAVPVAWLIVNCPFAPMPGRIGGIAMPRIVPGQLLAIAIVLAGLFEYTKMLGRLFPKNGFWLSFIWMGMQFIFFFFRDSPPVSSSLYILLIFVAVEAVVWGKRTFNRWKRASLFFSGTIFLYIAGISMLSMYHGSIQQVFRTFPAPLLTAHLGLAIILTSLFLCDTAAYFVGNAIGRRHFTRISPNKTIEGAIGGFCTPVIILGASWTFLARPHYAWYLGVILGVLIGIFAQVGDLLVSLIKRYFNVKDASDLIPGHGGILDRFDSLFFTAPVLGIFFWIVNKAVA